MAEFGMWGPAASGDRLAVQDRQAQQLKDLVIGKQRMGLMQQQQQMQQRAQTLDTLQKDRTQSLYTTGEDLIRGGNIAQGTAILNAASVQDLKTSQGEYYRGKAALENRQAQAKGAQESANLLASANSQDEYNRAVTLAEQTSGSPLPDILKKLTWSPQVKAQLGQLGVSAKDRVTMQTEQQRVALEGVRVASEERLKKAQVTKEEAMTREIETRTEKLAKVGGVNAVIARTPPADVKAALGMIKQDFPGTSDDDVMATNAANYIASSAQTLLQKNKGMDRNTAIYQAFAQAKKAGEITPTMKSSLFGKAEPKGITFDRNATNTPMTADRWASMKSGDTFTDEQGNVRRKP